MGKVLMASDVCHQAKEIMRSILPENTHEYITAKQYKDKILIVGVKEPVYGQEVMMRKQRIIQAINQKFGEAVVRDLRTRLITIRDASADSAIPIQDERW